MPRLIDLTGERYGLLVVLGRHGTSLKRNRVTWLCQCDCGNVTVKIGDDIKSRNTTSCGCLASRNFAGDRTRTHGMGKTKIYNVYRSMMNRCYNVKQKSYKDYGEKGIRVCEKWQTFDGFFEDMGNTYKEKLTIERIDIAGNYCKENCKWVTKEAQALNKSNNFLVTYNGETLPLQTICKKYNLSYSAIYTRIHRNKWDVIKALTTPIKKTHNKKSLK